MSDKPSSSPPSSINVLTFNCWGLKFISTLRQPRLAEIGRQIALLDPPPDIVGLQECWTQEDFAAICSATESILPYTKFYFTGVFGGGLAILSRWPIIDSSMSGYPLNGRPTAFFRGDWYVGKGIARACIKFGPGPKDIVQVFNTHVSRSPVSTQVIPILIITRLMHRMAHILIVSTHATAPPKPGKSPSSSAPPPKQATSSSLLATST